MSSKERTLTMSFIFNLQNPSIMTQCLNCHYVADDASFDEHLSHCPICKDETIQEMTLAEEALHIAINARCQNQAIISEYKNKTKDRYKSLRYNNPNRLSKYDELAEKKQLDDLRKYQSMKKQEAIDYDKKVREDAGLPPRDYKTCPIFS